MSLQYSIEAMTPADVVEVVQAERICFAFPWSERAFLSELALPYTVYLVARTPMPAPPVPPAPRGGWWSSGRDRAGVPTKGQLAGYGGLQVILDEGHITTLAVAPEHRGQGLGELLLLRMTEEARRRGVLRLTLEVRVSNYVAQNLYRKYGFEVEGRRLRYYGDGEDALIMWTGRLDAPENQARLEQLRRELLARMEQKS